MFIKGDSAPRSNPLPFYIPFFTKKVLLYIPSIDKWYPFHIPCKLGEGGGGGRGTQQMFIQGGSAPRSNPLPFYIPFFTKKVLLYIPSIDKWYPFHIPCKLGEGGGGGRGTQQMFIQGDSAPRSNPIPFYIPFFTKKVPRIPSIDKWYPFHIPCLELCIPFINFWALLQTQMTDFLILQYTSTSKTPTLLYTWSLKKVPISAEPPRIGHYREYLPLPPGVCV